MVEKRGVEVIIAGIVILIIFVFAKCIDAMWKRAITSSIGVALPESRRRALGWVSSTSRQDLVRRRWKNLRRTVAG